MEEFEKLEALVDHGKAYAQNRLDEAKLSTAEKASGIVALIAERSAIAIAGLICLLFVSAAGALALGERMGHEWQGFLVFGGFYFIVGCFLFAVKEKTIRIPVMNALIRYLFKDNDYETN